MAENTKKWEEAGRHYRTYIKLEKRLAQTNMANFLKENPKTIVPTLNSNSEFSISVRKPTN